MAGAEPRGAPQRQLAPSPRDVESWAAMDWGEILALLLPAERAELENAAREGLPSALFRTGGAGRSLSLKGCFCDATFAIEEALEWPENEWFIKRQPGVEAENPFATPASRESHVRVGAEAIEAALEGLAAARRALAEGREALAAARVDCAAERAAWAELNSLIRAICGLPAEAGPEQLREAALAAGAVIRSSSAAALSEST